MINKKLSESKVKWWLNDDVLVHLVDEKLPWDYCFMNNDYVEELDGLAYVWDDSTLFKLYEGLIEDSLKLISREGHKVGTMSDHYKETLEFIFSDNFKLYCEAIGLNGYEIQNGVKAIIEKQNFCDTRNSLSIHESALHQREYVQAAHVRVEQYINR
jgi:hypothetical protein